MCQAQNPNTTSGRHSILGMLCLLCPRLSWTLEVAHQPKAAALPSVANPFAALLWVLGVSQKSDECVAEQRQLCLAYPLHAGGRSQIAQRSDAGASRPYRSSCGDSCIEPAWLRRSGHGKLASLLPRRLYYITYRSLSRKDTGAIRRPGSFCGDSCIQSSWFRRSGHGKLASLCPVT
jgi:hypothetical protein